MSFLPKKLDVKANELVDQGKAAAQETTDQCVKEGQKVVQEVVDQGCQAAKDAGGKAAGQLKCGFKKN